MMRKRHLVTGGAGFIGSNLVEHFLTDERIGLIRILDDLSNGSLENIRHILNHPKVDFIEGDIRNYQTCLKACDGIDKISHQAALGSVPRSIQDPIASTHVNILGTINILHAAVQCDVDRVILAFSSSTYGDSNELPKIEDRMKSPKPVCRYKIQYRAVCECFRSYVRTRLVGLRYFNVFGPKQSPNNPYAAVIPIFAKALLSDSQLTINGDGKTSRDFTFVDNAVHMNDLALFTNNKEALNKIYNTACGESISLNSLVNKLEELVGQKADVVFGPPRDGDVQHSLASIDRARRYLGYQPQVGFEEGLKLTLAWYTQNLQDV